MYYYYYYYLMGMLNEILEENNDTSAMQENKQVDADVSVHIFCVLNDHNVHEITYL